MRQGSDLNSDGVSNPCRYPHSSVRPAVLSDAFLLR